MPYIIFPSEVIDIPKTEPVKNVCALDFIHLFGIMCYPSDSAARDRLAEAISSGNMLSVIEKIRGQYGNTHETLVDGGLTLWLAGAPDMMNTVGRAVEDAAFGGALAGNVPGWILFRGEQPETRAAVWRTTARVHDLRHTYASILASHGLSLPIIGALLGHTQPQTTARYAHLLDDPLRAATERVGAVVTAKAAKSADVVDIRKSANV